MELTWRGLAAAAITLNFGCSTHFRGDGGSLSVGLLQKIPCTNREVVLCIKNVMKGLLEENLSAVGVKSLRRNSTVSLLWAAYAAATAANVTNASFKSSPGQYPCKQL